MSWKGTELYNDIWYILVKNTVFCGNHFNNVLRAEHNCKKAKITRRQEQNSSAGENLVKIILFEEKKYRYNLIYVCQVHPIILPPI